MFFKWSDHSKKPFKKPIVRVMHHRTGHRQVFVGFSGCAWLARNSERSCGDRTSDAQTDTVRTSNSKVMSSLLLVRKCFLASSPLGRHSLELRTSVSRVFSPIARDWLKIRYCIIALHALSCGDHRCDLSICATQAAVLILWSTAERMIYSKRETHSGFC